MNEIKEYINRFFKRREKNVYYDITMKKLSLIAKATRQDMFDALSTTFDYGYVKGYRAAEAEQKMRVK